jgi:hypothetical protein
MGLQAVAVKANPKAIANSADIPLIEFLGLVSVPAASSLEAAISSIRLVESRSAALPTKGAGCNGTESSIESKSWVELLRKASCTDSCDSAGPQAATLSVER